MKEFFRLRRAFASILFVGLFAMATRNVLDPDVWWHLKTGEWMVQHHAVPHSDPFSYTCAGQPWTAHEWLSELAIYGLYRWTGYGGLIVVFAAIISAAFIPLYLRCGAGGMAAGTVVLWGALATAVVWGVRPQILSLALTSIWLLILERSERNPKLLWWTLPLTLLWVSLHAGFILGPVLLGLFLVGESFEIVLSGPANIRKERLLWLALALVGDLAVVPLNPNGASMFWYPVETLRSRAMQSHITEWASPNFHSIDYSALLLLILATYATLAFWQRRVRARDIVLLLAGTAAALSSARMIPLFVLIAVPIVSSPLGSWLAARNRSVDAGSFRSAFLNAGMVLAMMAFATGHTVQVIGRQPQAEAEHFPAAAAAYLRQHPPSGPIFNHDDWGGYLIFKLYPTTRVFIDGRADLYGEGLMQFVKTYYLQDCWQQPLSEWKVATVIVPPNSALASVLREMPGWSASFEDTVAVVFAKSDTAPPFPTCPFSDTKDATGRAVIRTPAGPLTRVQ